MIGFVNVGVGVADPVKVGVGVVDPVAVASALDEVTNDPSAFTLRVFNFPFGSLPPICPV